jgi:predicted acyltransferase
MSESADSTRQTKKVYDIPEYRRYKNAWVVTVLGIVATVLLFGIAALLPISADLHIPEFVLLFGMVGSIVLATIMLFAPPKEIDADD